MIKGNQSNCPPKNKTIRHKECDLSTILKNSQHTVEETDYSELLLLVLRRRKRFKVAGESMLPLLKPGDEILINPYAYQQSLPEIGDIVVTIHPQKDNLGIVKRVTAIAPDGNYFLTGDNLDASTDSRTWGTIKLQNIIGKVTSIFL